MMKTEIFKISSAHLLCSLLRGIQCDYSTQTEGCHLCCWWCHFYGNLAKDHIEMETLISEHTEPSCTLLRESFELLEAAVLGKYLSCR